MEQALQEDTLFYKEVDNQYNGVKYYRNKPINSTQ